MYQQAFNEITKVINNWSNINVYIVPGVMYQIKSGTDENDSNIEYQIHYFIDSTETYIHNHRHSFDTFCLEGEYLETTWEIRDDNSGKVIYQFNRRSGNIFDPPKKLHGVLHPVRVRHHFPGNKMHLSVEEYHSISPVNSNTGTFTFLRKKKQTSRMYVLSLTPTINAPSDEIRLATVKERQIMYEKLLHILHTKYPQQNLLVI